MSYLSLQSILVSVTALLVQCKHSFLDGFSPNLNFKENLLILDSVCMAVVHKTRCLIKKPFNCVTLTSARFDLNPDLGKN